MRKPKNKKIKVFGENIKVPNKVHDLLNELTNIIQLHEIAMIAWVKNCYLSDNQEQSDKYKEEFRDYIMSIPNSEDMIKRFEEVDKIVEEEKQVAKEEDTK